MIRILLTALLFAIVMSFGMSALVYSGLYDIGADQPHHESVSELLTALRDSSIERRSGDIVVPDDLDDRARVIRGAGNYDAMCAQCHRRPGLADTELSRGLYPTPPAFAEVGPTDPARAFWVIRHGIKLSGMPAWGGIIDEQASWDLVALLQALPDMPPEAYRDAVASGPGHGHGEAGVERR